MYTLMDKQWTSLDKAVLNRFVKALTPFIHLIIYKPLTNTSVITVKGVQVQSTY